jgi:tetraacyldisaccharide 4'-kinase
VTPASDLAGAHRLLTANTVTRAALLPLAWAWEAAAAARRSVYRLGLARGRRFDRPVIGVGNLAAGGAGKTPFVVFLARYFGNHGISVAVVSRGYGRESKGLVVVRRPGGNVRVGESAAGDEALMVARACPEATVVVAEDRAAGVAYAFHECGARLALLDDAYQSFAVAKDLDILLIDARRGPGPTLPAGQYREGPAAARMADVILFTKCREGDARGAWRRVLDRAGATAPVVEATYAPAYVRPVNGTERLPLKTLAGAKVLAFAGIADYDAFARDLAEIEAVVARRRPFPDHHRFNHAELADAEGTALVAGCDCLVTTAKDEARLEGWRPRVTTYVLELSLEVTAGEETLNRLLDASVKAARGESRRGG